MSRTAKPAEVRTPEPAPPPTPDRSIFASQPSDQAEPGTGFHPYRLVDLRRSERSMIIVRWAGVAFAVVQVLAYRELPYPPGVKEIALGLAGFLAVANLFIWYAYTRTETLTGAHRLAIASLAVDVAVASGFVWLYAFDPSSALWALLFIIPLEGAIKFGLTGALVSWVAITILYLARELWRVEVFPSSVTGPAGYPFEPESVSFRMGIGLLIALVAGMMARNLTLQRAQLTDALGELSRTDALRSRMVATLAHDVRNPLTTIRGTLKTIARHSDRLDRRTLGELVATAEKQGARIERLAADLLDLARTESGRLELSVSDVDLRQAVEGALGYIDEYGRFEVDIEEGVKVRADPRRLEQIIVNLVANAFRYGEAPFLVSARPGPSGTTDILFRDHGAGVPRDERDHLFEPFRTETARGSVGLGLAIVKALTEAQGGSVGYEESTPRGACFRVRLLEASG
jgi:signal transduction histidine kinase